MFYHVVKGGMIFYVHYPLLLMKCFEEAGEMGKLDDVLRAVARGTDDNRAVERLALAHDKHMGDSGAPGRLQLRPKFG